MLFQPYFKGRPSPIIYACIHLLFFFNHQPGVFANITLLFYSGCRCSSSTCKSVNPGRFIWGNMFFAMNAADSLLWTRHIPFSPQDQATKPDQIVSPNGRSWPSTSSYLPSHTSFPFAWNKCIRRPPSVVKIILPKVLLKATTLVFFVSAGFVILIAQFWETK